MTGFGWRMSSTKMPFEEAMALLGKDLLVARGRAAVGDKPSYFARKAQLVEECINAHEARRSEESKTGLDVGYAPGRKYLYPGLPVSLAISVDRAIIEVIDLMARCEHVVMTGACCAGHPSKQIPNPFPQNSCMASEKQIYAQNFSPYFNIMLPRDEAGDGIIDMLCGIRTQTTLRGMSVGIAATMNGTGQLHEDVMVLPITGVPTFNSARAAPAYPDVVALYQHALADFWRAVKSVFEEAARERVDDLKPDEFVHRTRLDARFEFALIAERRAKGMTHPNYLYFNGTTDVTRPTAG